LSQRCMTAWEFFLNFLAFIIDLRCKLISFFLYDMK
jgi:hypothetical protein